MKLSWIRCLACILGGIILFTLFLLLTGQLSAAESETTWGRWNIAPYAKSFVEACKKAPMAIDGLNLPQAVKVRFKQALGADCKGGAEVWLVPHQRFEEMWSGGQKPHVMKNVTVAELPVMKSPDGRPYRSGAVAETAKALEWTVEYEGKKYVLYLPFACFNWSWNFAPAPLAVAEKKKCRELSFDAPTNGKVRWSVATTTGPLPPDECNAQRQGNGTWFAWYGECEECSSPIKYLRGILGDVVQVPHKYLYAVKRTRQTLRFSEAVRDAVVSICLEDAQGAQSCGVYMRPQDWKGRAQVEISSSFFAWADCPQ